MPTAQQINAITRCLKTPKTLAQIVQVSGVPYMTAKRILDSIRVSVSELLVLNRPTKHYCLP